MSRAYRISVSDSIKRHIKVEKGVLSHGHIYSQSHIHEQDKFRKFNTEYEVKR